MKKANLLYQIVILIILSGSLFTQQPTLEWVRRYSPNENLSASGLSVKQDSIGNIYILVAQATDTTYGDYGLLKYTHTGDLLWSTVYNSPGNLDDKPIAFDVTEAGDVYITGSSGINFVYHILTVKFNTNGIFQWAREYNRGYSDAVGDISLDKQDNIIICGNSAINNTTSALIVKYSSTGDTLWVRKFTQFQHSFTGKLVIDDSSNVYTAGYYEVGTQSTYYLTLKYNQNGDMQWYSSYGVTGYGAIANSIAVDSNRNVYVVGVLNVPQPGFWDNVLIKINTNGALQWARNYSGINNNHSCSGLPVGLAVTLNGNGIYYTTYVGNGQGGGAKDIVTLKYDSLGDSIWVRRYNGGVFASANVPKTLKLDRYNNTYVAGYADYTSTGTDYVTIKYLSSGIQQWVATYNGFSNYIDYANDVIVDSSNVFVTGYSNKTTSISSDAVTMKYNQIIGILNNSTELPKEYKLHQNYPNPFNSTTIINYEIPKKSFIELKIYNSIGRLVRALVIKDQDQSYYTILFNSEEFSSGVYFYTLFCDNKLIDTKKMILIK